MCDAVFEKEQTVVEGFSGGKLKNVALRLLFVLFWLFCCYIFVVFFFFLFLINPMSFSSVALFGV